MESERCDICLQGEKNVGKVSLSPLLIPLLLKHLGIIVLKDLVSCAQCSQLLQLWDEFSIGSRENIVISHPECIFQPIFITSVKNDETNEKPKDIKAEAVSPNPDTKIQFDDLLVSASSTFPDTKNIEVKTLCDSSEHQDYTTEADTTSETAAKSTVCMPPDSPDINWSNPEGEKAAVNLLYSYFGFFDSNDSNQGDVECAVCGSVFERHSHLTVHIKSQHRDKQVNKKKNISCPLCVKDFAFYQELLKHLLDSHIEQSRGVFTCVFCEKVFGSKNKFFTHAKMHLGSAFYFPCNQCSKLVSTKKSLRKHIQTHADPSYKPKKCNPVDPSYGPKKSKAKLRKEMKVCEYCGDTVPRQSIATHIKRVHKTKEKGTKNNVPYLPYQCMICKEWFATMRDLTRHTPSHEQQSMDTSQSINDIICSEQNPSDLRIKIRKNRGSFSCENINEVNEKTILDCEEIENTEISPPTPKLYCVERKIQQVVPLKHFCNFCDKLLYSKIAMANHIEVSHISKNHHLQPEVITIT